MSYSDSLILDLRLHALEILTDASDYTANEVVLQDRLRVEYGHTVSSDRLRSDLAWLDEQGLVIVQKPGGIHLATLTLRGMDVARGASTIPGVARPRPGR